MQDIQQTVQIHSPIHHSRIASHTISIMLRKLKEQHFPTKRAIFLWHTTRQTEGPSSRYRAVHRVAVREVRGPLTHPPNCPVPLLPHRSTQRDVSPPLDPDKYVAVYCYYWTLRTNPRFYRIIR